MEKVFIAGGTGMLGAAAAKALSDAGVKVVVSSRKDRDEIGEMLTEYSPLIEVEKVELLDLESVEAAFAKHAFDGMAVVAHTHQYAQTRDKNNEIYPILINCFETARKSGVKRAVMAGSMAVYGGLTPPLTETVTFPPIVGASAGADRDMMKTFEVATKRAIEIIVMDYGDDFQMGLSIPPGLQKPEPHELETVILRAPLMFGPGYQALGNPLSIAAHVAAGRIDGFQGFAAYGGAPAEALWASLSSIPVNYVKDNAECIRIALTADTLPNRIYNINSGFSRSPREQFEAILRAAPDSADRMGITPEDLPNEAVDLGFTGDLFEEDFGWTSSYSLESALADYIGWLKDHPY